jgi:nucleotide-binding universal stress UspA family protein
MKTILVPTDFSENAGNALSFALNILKKSRGKLILFHAYSVQLIDPNMPAEIYLSAYQEAEKISKENLERLEKKIIEENKADGLEFMSIVRQGLVVDEVISITEDEKVDLIVMGTHGSSGITEIFLGSNTSSVIEKAPVPVLAIPDDFKFSGINSIVYAYDEIRAGSKALKRLLDFGEIFNSDITLLHIIERDDSDEKNKSEFNKIKEEFSFEKLKLVLVKEDDVIEGINKYIDENNADVLAMAIHKRNLIEKIFDRSLTKKMAHHTKIPLLALHVNG